VPIRAKSLTGLKAAQDDAIKYFARQTQRGRNPRNDFNQIFTTH
jgi:hypothetical protein